MESFPYYSHTFRDSYGSGMGIVWVRGPMGWDVRTFLKFNMEPENGPLEEEIPFENYHFQLLC